MEMRGQLAIGPDSLSLSPVRRQVRRRALALAVLAVPVLSMQAMAATYYWDPNPSTAIAGNDVTEGGAGTWDTTAANFTTSSTDSSAVNHVVWSSVLMNAGTDTVVFGGTAGGAITLNSFATGGQLTGSNGLGITNLTFATSGYTLSGSNGLRFITSSGSITVNPGVTATINNSISNNGLTGYTVDGNVDINGGGTLRLGGFNSGLGFTVASGTTVELTGGLFSGWSTNTINGVLRNAAATSPYQAQSSINGSGTFDLNGVNSNVSTLGGTLGVTNSTNTGSSTLNVTMVASGTTTHTGVISNGAGKLSLAFTGTTAQGSGFSNSVTVGTQVLAGTNTYTGSTSLGRGTITLDFTNAAAPANNILYNSGFGASPTGTDGRLIIGRPLASTTGFTNASVGTLVNLNVIGKASTSHTQAFSGLQVDANAAASVLIGAGTNGTMALDLGSSITRSSGGVVNFATGGVSVSATPTASTSGTNTLTFSLTDVNTMPSAWVFRARASRAPPLSATSTMPLAS